MSDVAPAEPLSENKVLGHEAGLFLLFFTEMWERFSYYGMRALLVLFLVSETAAGGWGWTSADALWLYGIYTGLVYLTPILGGIVADKLLGYRGAVLLGALLMTLGHGALAFETAPMFYTGLGLLIFGNGFFKPNISTMVGQLYENNEEKKDAAYTIFYMGINAGAFLGILLCGFIGEQIGWSYGFGVAGIFMFLGMIMFYLGQPIFGDVGNRRRQTTLATSESTESIEDEVIVKDRLIVVGILSFFTIFFWMAFEQAGGSLTIFAKDFTGRVLTGNAHWMFLAANTFLTIAPLAIVTWVLLRMVKATSKKIPISNTSIIISFVLIWCIALAMLYTQFNNRSYEISFQAPVVSETEIDHETQETDAPRESSQQQDTPQMEEVIRMISSSSAFAAGDPLTVVDIEQNKGRGKLKLVSTEEAEKYESKFNANVVRERQNETEVPASWFGILNSFFIIAFAPLFGKIWASRLNPSAPVKFALGLILLGLGFGAVAVGSSGIPKGAESASISLWWLVLAYLFHTLGELCLSPVGLSYVSKLAPPKWVGLMFGVWFGCTAIANYLAGWTGSFIEPISEQYGLTLFFMIYTAIPILAGVALILMKGMIKTKMHGIE